MKHAKQKTKMSISEFATSLTGKSFNTELETMLALYSDCYDQIEHINRVEIMGNPKGYTEELSRKRFIDCGQYLPRYNAFKPEMIKTLAELFGENARYTIAREGSVCIYVRLTTTRIWLNRIMDDLIEMGIDEISVEANGSFRLWWD